MTRKYGQSALSALSWKKRTYQNVDYYAAKADPEYTVNSDAQGNTFGYCIAYTAINTTSATALTSGQMTFYANTWGGGECVTVRDDSISSVSELVTKLTSKGEIVFKKKNPTTESSAALPVPQVVYDGGTESYVDERDVQMPVGQNATYMDATSAIGELMDSGLVPSSSGVSQTSGTFVLGGTGTTITSQWNYVKTGKEVTIYGGFANWMSSSTMTTLFGLPFTPAYSTPVHVSCYVLNVGKFDVVMRLNTDKTMTVECATLIGTNGTVTYIPVPSSTFAYYLIYLTAEIRYITNE